MKSHNNLLKNIERLGERYCKRHLDSWNNKKLEGDWWEALKFFFSHSFMRGRRDELSTEYYYFTIRTLESYFSFSNQSLDRDYEKIKEQEEYFNKECILKFKKEKNIGRGNSIKHEDFKKEVAENNPIIKLLIAPKKIEVEWDHETYHKKLFLGNDEDVMMVLDVLKFISNDKKNIYNYLKNMIVDSGVKAAYEKLTKMRGISDKLATFTIRDIGLINFGIVNKDFEWAFPVDTWVIKIARKIGCNSKDIKEIKQYFIEKCKDIDIDPLKFAAGLWFLGFNSLDILLENCLDEIEIGKII